jgi:thiol:disulfide interchange protein DsbD
MSSFFATGCPLSRKYLFARFPFVLFLFPGFLTGGALAQDSTRSNGMLSSTSVVGVTSLLSVKQVPAGKDFQAAVVLSIQEPWHVNANNPKSDYLIGTELALTPPKGLRVLGIKYPPAQRFKFDFSSDTLEVYQGRVPIILSLNAAPGLAPGTQILKGELTVQACDNSKCIAPGTKEIAIPIQVVGADQPVVPANTELFSGFGLATGTPPYPTVPKKGGMDIAAAFQTRGTLFAFIAIFLMGLALNLTPCVYPMLSVTVSVFGGQTDTHPLRVFLKALVYVLGMATMYSILGVVAALSGGIFGGLLQNPWVLGGIGVLLLGLALSMFGLYEVQAPYWLTSKLGGARTTGIVGIYLSGLVVGVFAAPCIGPPVIALLALVAARGDALFGFGTFFVLSMGLGLPFLILGTFTGLLRKIPKSGAWMVWVQRVFGVILTGVGLFYLGLAVYPKLADYVIPVTLLLGGIYLGFVDRSGKANKTLRGIQWAVGIAGIVASIFFLRALLKPGTEWERFSPQKLSQARAGNKPVILDFTAAWCVPCKELDRITFTSPEVIQAAHPFVKMKVDLTHFNSPEAEALRKQFGIQGVPTILFLDPGGREVPNTRVIGFLAPEPFLERLRLVPGL